MHELKVRDACMTEVEKLLRQIDARGYTHIIFDLDATLTLLNLP